MTSLRGPPHNGGGPEACCSVQICQLRALEKALIYHGDPFISTFAPRSGPSILLDTRYRMCDQIVVGLGSIMCARA